MIVPVETVEHLHGVMRRDFRVLFIGQALLTLLLALLIIFGARR